LKLKALKVIMKKNPVEENFQVNHKIDYDDDSGDDFAVITKTSGANDSSPAKTMFSIKTISNSQLQNSYKISKTAVDLDHPGNINGVPTTDYDLSKLVDEYKPWKKPGADVSDYFNYGFTEETWLLYCEKQKTLRLSQENSALKTLSGLQNFGYPLSGSHIHLGFNRSTHKTSKGGLIDVIGSQQSAGGNEYKNKHNDINLNIVNKISTIPVQTGNVNVGQNQANNYMSGLTNQAISNNLLNPIMSAAMAMGILPNAGNVQVLTSQPNASMDAKMSQFNTGDGGNMRNNHSYNGGGANSGNWANNSNNQNYDRSNSVDSMHSHEDYDRKPYMKSDRGSRRSDHEESRRYRSRERREHSSERRRRSRSRSRERAHESKHSRKRNRTPEDNRRHRKHSHYRHSSGESDRKHRRHRSGKRHRQSRSPSYDKRKDRHQRRHKSPGEDSGKFKTSYKEEAEVRSSDKNETNSDNVKREMDYPNAD